MKQYQAIETGRWLTNIECEIARQNEQLREALREADIEPVQFQRVLEFSLVKTPAINWRCATRA